MHEHFATSMQVGDTVCYDGYATDVIGIIVERVSKDYVRVKWADMKSATTHRHTSLRRPIVAAS